MKATLPLTEAIKPPFWSSLLICLFLLVGGVFLEKHQLDNARRSSLEHLQMIAKVKADQLDHWLEERSADTAVLASAGNIVSNYRLWLRNGDKTAREQALARLEEYRQAYRYLGISLVDSAGKTVLASGQSTVGAAPPGLLRRTIAQASQSGRVASTDLYPDARGGQRILLDFVAGFATGPGEAPLFVVLQTDTADFLFPFLLAIPMKSETGEMVLLHQDDRLPFALNELRHRKDAPFLTPMPTLLAAAPSDGGGEVIDYRGHPVLQVGQPLKGMPWRLVAKEDVAEALAKSSWEIASVPVATIALMLLVIISNYLRYQRARLVQSNIENAQKSEQLLMQSELRESNQRFIDIARASKDWIWETNAAGTRFTYVSDNVTANLGFTPEEFLQLRLSDVFPEAEREQITETLRNLRGNRQIFRDLEHPMLHKNGSVRYVMTNGVPIFDGNGNFQGYRGIDRDITTKRAKEATIRQLSLAVEQGMNGILIANLDYEIEYVNDAYCRQTGYAREELLGRSPCFNGAGLTSQGSYEELESALLAGRVWRGRFHNETKQGEVRVDYAVISPLRQPDGQVTHYVAICEDITELENQRNELERYREHLQELVAERTQQLDAAKSNAEQAEQLLREAVNSVAQGFIIFDRDDRFLLCNNYYRDCFPEIADLLVPGTPFTEILKSGTERDLFVFEDEAARQKWTAERLQAHHNNDFPPFEDQLKSGRWLLTMEFRTPSGYYVGNRVDITALKNSGRLLAEARDQANSANKAKSLFLANMSHEIRSPMNAIIGLSHLCLNTDLPPKGREYVRKVQKAATLLLDIINDILDFSKIEAGKMQIERKPFMIEDVIGHSTDLFHANLAERGIDFIVRIAPDVPSGLIGDSLRLGQILTNLLSNASKFTERGSIELDVCLANSAAGSEHAADLMFSVRDTGIGMTPEQQENLFQVFTQVDASITRKFGGTGLGLTICRELVELMGGRISLESAIGHGTRFSFSLHFDTAPAPLAVPQANTLGRVLVVDDDPIGRTMLLRMLEKFGFVVHAAASGEEALAQIAATSPPYSLIFMDWKMPGMDGFATSQQIRTLPDYREVPIIMITAANMEDIDAMDARGINHYMFKPLQVSLLFETIMDVLAGSIAPPQPVGGEKKPLVGRQILVVDDSEFNQEVAADLLAMAGAVVTIAEDGQKAVDTLARQSFDLVLMDMQMPVMDGITATQAIRAQPRYAHLPIIAMTANALPEERQRCLDAGMNDFVAKPIDPAGLADTLAVWLHDLPPGQPEGTDQTASPGPAPGPATVPDNSAQPEQPAIDCAAGLGFVMGNRKLYAKLLDNFLTTQVTLASQLHQGMAEGDSQLVMRSAHTLRGIAGTLGAKALSDAAGGLEHRVKTGAELAELEDWMRALVTELEAAVCAGETLRESFSQTP